MEKVETLANDIVLMQPDFIIAVPRVFNRIYNGIQAKMKEAGGMKLLLFTRAVAAAKKRRELAEQGKSSVAVNMEYKLLDKLVFSKIRDRFGGRLQGSVTASATMNTEIAHFFMDIGIPLYDAYGLTETSPAVTINSPNAYRLGSVGKPLDQVRLVIDKTGMEEGATDGEIIVYGPNVMQGYHNKPKETAAVMTEDGGFRTGDRGRVDKDGYLYITGRIKEQFKLENGKYVFPAGIEEEMKLLPCVLNAMVYGEGKSYNICLVYPDKAYVLDQGKKLGLAGEFNDLIKEPKMKEHLVGRITSILEGKFGSYELPKKYVFLEEDFTLDNGMLTQTMKLKRRVVVERYKKEIEAQYA